MLVKLKFLLIFILSFIYSTSSLANSSIKSNNSKFPLNFKFGATTSSYQIEGGWNADGKGPSSLDVYTHQHPEKVEDSSNADVSADSYNRFDDDLKLLKELGVDFYRFSISWPRILPNGDLSVINSAGIKYYNMMIDKLLENGIEPIPTMFQFDLPHQLELKTKGFLNPLFYEQFEKYADVLYQNFGDRVKRWITLSEPYFNCKASYDSGIFPPAINSSGVLQYQCFDNMIKAHAIAYRLYQNKYFPMFGGKIGLCLKIEFYYSEDNNTELVNRALQFGVGIFAHPIYTETGGYPDIVVNAIAKNSQREGRNKSRLPQLTDEWRETIKGSSDFFVLNYYTSKYISYDPTAGYIPSRQRDTEVRKYFDPNCKKDASDVICNIPQGFEDSFKWIRDNYNNVEVIVGENGWADKGTLDDDDRINYHRDHLQALLNAVKDGCNVVGYSPFALMDNFNFQQGYKIKFGLYHVDFNNPNRTRTAKKSAKFYKKAIKTKKII